MKSLRGFTLIELLVVISVIGILAAVIIASLNSARDKAKSAAIKQEARQLFSMAMTHFAETGDFSTFSSGGYTKADGQAGASASTCTARILSTAVNRNKAIEICNSITSKLPTNRLDGGSANNKMLIGCGDTCSTVTDYSVSVKLEDSDSLAGSWMCTGSSGITREYPSYSHTFAGCYYRP